MKDDRAYLLHIQECITDIQQFVGAAAGGKSTFLSDKKAQGATLRALQILSE